MSNKRYDITQQPVVTSTPQRPLGVTEDVVVPLLQSLVSGLMLSLLATGVVWGFLGLELLPVFLVSFGASVIASWFWRLGVVTETLWKVEELTGIDVTGDNVVGQPQTVRLEIATPTGQRVVDLDGLASADLRQFAIHALTGRLNERVARDKFGLSQLAWNGLRDSLIARRILQWKGRPNSTAGVALTDEGVALMRQILDRPSG